METTRVDKWLWTVRIFKSRSLATEACKSGKVKIDEQKVKPSREVKVEDIIHVNHQAINKIFKVKQILKNRVSAKLATEAMEDLTPAEEYDKLKIRHELNYERRDHGLGRPTKRDRRDINKLKDLE
mgnify:CR=1 FL=1